MKYYNKRQNAVNILFGASSKSVFQLLERSTWQGLGLLNRDITTDGKYIHFYPTFQLPPALHISLHIASVNFSKNRSSLSYFAKNGG